VSVVLVVIVMVLAAGFLGAVFWNALRAEPNAGPALGTNNPYPDGVGVLGPGEDEPAFLPTPIISDAEEFRRDAGRRLAELHGPSGNRSARSWMEEAGAMEAAGLVDEPAPSSADAARPQVERGGHRRGKKRS